MDPGLTEAVGRTGFWTGKRRVASELIVRDSHSTQATPATVEELRRILSAHLSGQ